jgi:cytidine deaminase
MVNNKLLDVAFQARSHAYAPYSSFPVGAALMTKNGKIFSGCNVENVSLGLTICAERAAVAAAIADGEREFTVIAIVTDSSEPAVPCGACRQVLAEFNPSMKIIASTVRRRVQEFSLSDLLPRPRQGILEHLSDV